MSVILYYTNACYNDTNECYTILYYTILMSVILYYTILIACYNGTNECYTILY